MADTLPQPPPTGVGALCRDISNLRGVRSVLSGYSDLASRRRGVVSAVLLGREGVIRQLLPHATAILGEAYLRGRQVPTIRNILCTRLSLFHDLSVKYVRYPRETESALRRLENKNLPKFGHNVQTWIFA